MKFDYTIDAGVQVLTLSGDLIGEDADRKIWEPADQALAGGVRACVLDIAQLRYINSSGLGLLITLLTKFRNKGGEVYLMNPSESVQKLLMITKLNAIFRTVKSKEEALALSNSPA
jgi:anti-sigma B factor antagonist